MARTSGATPGVGLAGTENRIGLGVSANPSLPPGVGLGSGMPRGMGGASASPSAQLNGLAESTGNGLNSAVANIIKSMGASGGTTPGGSRGIGSRGPRATEKPSVARSGAIARRLNGGASQGKELKGL